MLPKRNFKKKEYEKMKSEIKKEFKSNSSHRDNYLRKIETCEKYDDDMEKIVDNINGLEIFTFENKNVLTNSYHEIINIVSNKHFDSSRMTNYRFYINTPYFDRKGTDEFPLFNIDDSRVKHMKELKLTSNVLKNKTFDIKLLNILVRVYKYGDILNFHTDRDIFGDEIYGIVVYNANPSRGIMLTNGLSSCIVKEESGTIWKLSGDARWNYEHGYSSEWKNYDEIVRIVISFRFFDNLKQIPKKSFEPME
jgi:hypothetical protein